MFACVASLWCSAARSRAQEPGELSEPPELPPPQQPPQAEELSFGVQLAADALLNDPVLVAQLGLLLHLRVDPEWSFRAMAAYGVAPGLEEEVGVLTTTHSPGPDRWQVRHMVELRPSAGYSIDPAVEVRGFATLRWVAIDYGQGEELVGYRGGEPIYRTTERFWSTYWWLGAGSEWIFRPETSRRLELGVSLGIGAQILVRSWGTTVPSVPLVHAAASAGWRFL